ncbi:DUF803-domain-containing protein [Tilletiaria anomala UBC 951]|uniref:DUF803-domain-containing protein n=1 Tax=Tilletiaria anomala (strain ATCC 24038 / CBS 436.72 / UBC 951) TaxID=1037660 RepID=A0A066WRB5_TILAU|nr:DUF803-domain-containing protein [Tilletiaria anomala UBC 951]KDN53195.1 DUF803-domain-containing protein [Tilletiaria anomala UBC 951]
MNPTPTRVLALLARQAAESSANAAASGALPTSINTTASASSAMASLSSLMASASQALASESKVAAGDDGAANPGYFKYIGIAMAISSGFFIGSSFVLKKRGLLAAQKKFNSTAGEGLSYLKSPLWWSGMIIMILGEVLNLVAYSFTDAILVTPMGALSVVVSAILSSFFLEEKLSMFGWLGCGLCILGSTIIALNGPDQHASGQIKVFEKMFIAPGFLAWTGVCLVVALGLIFFAVPKWGKKNMLVHISICSVIGGLSVSVTSGLGSAILLSIRGQNQFKYWFIYFLLGFVIVTLVTEIIYLNKALELFNTAMVTPTYYVLFTFMTLVTSIVLFQGLSASVVAIVTIVLGFLVICVGITILQLSKIDPEDLAQKPGIDRSTTMLLKASRSHLRQSEKGESTQIEDPGVDTIRGGLGIVGSVIRARSSSRLSRRFNSSADEYRVGDEMGALRGVGHDVERYQLHDGPVPRSPLGGGGASASDRAISTMPPQMPLKRDTAISWASGTEGHDREKVPGSPLAGPGFGPGGSAMATLSVLTPTSEEADLSGTTTSTAMSSSATPADEYNNEEIVRRVYHTEPRGALQSHHDARAQLAAAHGGPLLQGAPGGPSSSSALQQGKYIDPYAVPRSVGPALPVNNNIRTMWEHAKKGPADVTALSEDGSGGQSEFGLSSVLNREGEKQRSDKEYPLRKGGRPSSEEDELLRPQATNDSEEEEERAKERQQRRFAFF